MGSLFTDPSQQRKLTPLAERMRPRTLSEVAGQAAVVDVLRELMQRTAVPSLILWGPPGCGKTTIARLLAGDRYEFVQMSAVLAGVKDVREAVEGARRRREHDNRGTLLFLDEIHRFNKAQQDVLLPHVERGTIVLAGATTENPSFEVIGPLLSRCRVLTLDALSAEDIETVLERALTDAERGLGIELKQVEDRVLGKIAALAAGDARFALNTLEVCAGLVGATPASPETEDEPETPRATQASPLQPIITTAVLKRALAGRSLLYDKSGDEHFNAISALHKALRGSDPDAALYWMARMLEGGEDPKYVVRRLIRFASEDVGLADPWALHHANAARSAVEFLGMPECNTALCQLAVYLACAPKSNAMYKAYGAAKEAVKRHGALPAPLHIRNAPTRLMKELGYGKDYHYAHDYAGGFVADNYWPDQLAENPPRLVHLTGRGMEKQLQERLRHWWGDRFEGESDKDAQSAGGASVPACDRQDKPEGGASVPACDRQDRTEGGASVPACDQSRQALEIKQRRLPHWRLEGAVYFVTWRLAEGAPLLAENERTVVQQALRHFNQERYVLYAYVVMDDHVHVVFRPQRGHDVSNLMHNWKSYTAHEIQRSRGTKGQLWLHESWDRIIRDENELIKQCQYVLGNPYKRWPEIRDYTWVGWD